MLPPNPRDNIILFQLDCNIKFPLLYLLQFLRDLKSTILRCVYDIYNYNLMNNIYCILDKPSPIKVAMNSQAIFENYDLDQQLKIIKVNITHSSINLIGLRHTKE